MRYFRCLLFLFAVTGFSAQADTHRQVQQGYSNSGNADVVVDMPPDVWTQGQNRRPDCARCCIFEDRTYSEGAVVKTEGVLLQCSRDEKSLGTNNLIWQRVQ